MLLTLGRIQMGATPTFGQGDAASSSDPVLNFDGKKYAIKALSDETKELIKGVRAADGQLKFHEDTLKVIALGRQALALRLKKNLENSPELGA